MVTFLLHGIIWYLITGLIVVSVVLLSEYGRVVITFPKALPKASKIVLLWLPLFLITQIKDV